MASEKQAFSGVAQASDAAAPRASKAGVFKWFIVFVLGCVVLFTKFDLRPSCLGGDDSFDDSDLIATNGSDIRRVPLDIYIMSKCPDARDCLRDLVVPAMANISHLVDFNLEFIGETKGDELVCKHGPEECMGNIIELCAAELYPDPKIHLGFVNCMTKDYEEIPSTDLIESCAASYGIDAAKLRSCFQQDDGDHGRELLRESIVRTAKARVVKSCTVRLNEHTRCIRDGGKWINCLRGSTPSDLIRDVRRAARRANKGPKKGPHA